MIAKEGEHRDSLKIKLPCDPAISFLGIYMEEMKHAIQKDICTPVFIIALRHGRIVNVHQQKHMNG